MIILTPSKYQTVCTPWVQFLNFRPIHTKYRVFGTVRDFGEVVLPSSDYLQTSTVSGSGHITEICVLQCVIVLIFHTVTKTKPKVQVKGLV